MIKMAAKKATNDTKCICQQCGCVNIVEITDKENPENWLPCLLPEGFEWTLPSGKITPVVGEPIYKDAMGANFSRKDYLAKYNIDPEIAYTKMRATIGNPVPVPVGASTGNKPKIKTAVLGKGGKG
jgi:hypothetical protein